MKIFILVVAVLASLTMSSAQPVPTTLGDGYAKAALRAVIASSHTDRPLDEVVLLLDEADVQASAPGEEHSLLEINRILSTWHREHTVVWKDPCYVALKSALKRRDGATPEVCKASQ